MARLKKLLQILSRYPLARETGIFLAYCAFTSVLTWPYVTRLRDAVVDAGDPYLVSWILWWDYHQTFTNPLRLFESNLFYPYHHTLAFSEHCYGIALLFFPLFALGLRPLTVHAVAMFFGFAGCGYGAFRLARTLTGSYAVAWLAGIVFAFGPFRFHYMSHLPYLFTLWMPLLFEALILFLKDRTWKRAAWLGTSFLMIGLTTISWLVFSVVPFIVVAAVLLTRHNLWRDRMVWHRGGVAISVACLALLPFMVPYYLVSKLYGFERNAWEVKANSAWPVHWLSAEVRNKFWGGMGSGVPQGYLFKLFPGLIPLFFSAAALMPSGSSVKGEVATPPKRRVLKLLDLLIVLGLCLTMLSVGYDKSEFYFGFFRYFRPGVGAAGLLILIFLRICFQYPQVFGLRGNVIDTLRSSRRSDAFWVGTILFVVGFLYSLGWNFFFYRLLYTVFLPFRSMRVPTRGAMVAYLGLSLLTGLGAMRIAKAVSERWSRISQQIFFTIICALALLEFNAAPLKFLRGEVYPDAVTLRLKQTDMRGGIVVLPAGEDFNYRSMLRAADHAKPLIVGTSGFNPPYEVQIEILTREQPISDAFLDLLEQIPASYLVVNTDRIKPERQEAFRVMLDKGIASGRLRFVNRFDDCDDLFAVTKIEPGAQSESQYRPDPEALIPP